MSWKKFTYRAILFLIPIVILVIGVEVLVRNIPNSISVSGEQLEEDNSSIKFLVLGSSQNKRAINPEFLTSNTLTVAGTRQGHKTDFYLLKDLHKHLPNLKRVFVGVTARHFESPPNGKNFWKYRSHLVYYNVNAFERPVYFKDKFIFLGNPNFYSDQLEDYYIKNKKLTYNKFGFQLTGLNDRFAKFHHNEEEILKTFNSGNYPSLNRNFLDLSSKWFHKILEYCQENNIQVSLTKTPTFKNYNPLLDRDVLKRRDSIVDAALTTYPNIGLFDEEENTLYKANHFINENHLNPKGAELFTKRLEQFLKESTFSQN